jgi:hypothetical protein
MRIAIAVVAVVALVAGFLVARSATSSEDADTDTVATVVRTVVVTTSTDGTPAATTTVETRPKVPAPPTIVIRGGQPVGGVRKLRYRKGETIRFRVKSDVEDEIHFHGYDLSKPVGPGKTVTMTVPATIDGLFEVELENLGVAFAEVEVRP